MPASEFTEWQGYWMLEPWGAIRNDMHTSRLEALLYNVNRAKDAPARQFTDFMYRDKWQAKEDQKAEFAKSVLGFIRRNNEAMKNG